jgi:hypothetical protein
MNVWQNQHKQFDELQATALFCPKCRQATPVRQKLTVNSMSISVNIAAAQWGPKRLPSNQTSSSQLAEETGIQFIRWSPDRHFFM